MDAILLAPFFLIIGMFMMSAGFKTKDGYLSVKDKIPTTASIGLLFFIFSMLAMLAQIASY